MNKKIGLYTALIILIKLLFLFTHHIQEDAFISWRVAQNILDYGVIGFNGAEKISASTTYLYVFISALFNCIFGKENFIYPILIFNSILFTLGSYYFSRLFFKETQPLILCMLAINFLPPSLKISILGMEYGLVFFLYMSFMYVGYLKRNNWAFFFFPIVLLWTRIDTAVFLGLFFAFDFFTHRKWNGPLMAGGIFGFFSLMIFNYFYFNEWINNTIIAKSLAYPYHFNFQVIFFYAMQYLAILKIPETFLPINFLTLLVLILECIGLYFLLTQTRLKNKKVYAFLFCFAWIKQIIFIGRMSLFDWYYWIPQILLFSVFILYILEQPQFLKKFNVFLLLVIFPLVGYQTIHSIASGNGEWNYRKSIGDFLNTHEPNKNEYIFLEPAGYIPYYSQLKTIDFVGLVDKSIQKEIIQDPHYFIQPTLQKRKPKYYLSLHPKEKFKTHQDSLFFHSHYQLYKKYSIDSFLHSDHKLLEKIYQLKPSGRDYWLYKKVQ